MRVRPARALLIVCLPLLSAQAHATEALPETFRLPGVEVLEGFSFSLETGIVSEEVSRVSIGTLILGPGNEIPLVASDGRITAGRVGFDVGYDWGERFGGYALRSSLHFDHTAGGDHGFASEQPGGRDTALTYHDLAPSGSPGLNLGDGGLDASSELDLSAYNLRLVTSLELDVCEAADVELLPSLSLAIGGREQQAHGFAVAAFDPGVNMATDQDVRDRYFGGGFGLGVAYQVTPRIGLFADAGIDLYHRDSELRSVQRNRCGLLACTVLGDDDFTVAVSRDRSDFAWGSRLDLGASYRWDRLDVKLGMGFDYRSRQGDLVNPVSPPVTGHEFLQHRNDVAPRGFLSVSYRF